MAIQWNDKSKVSRSWESRKDGRAVLNRSGLKTSDNQLGTCELHQDPKAATGDQCRTLNRVSGLHGSNISVFMSWSLQFDCDNSAACPCFRGYSTVGRDGGRGWQLFSNGSEKKSCLYWICDFPIRITATTIINTKKNDKADIWRSSTQHCLRVVLGPPRIEPQLHSWDCAPATSGKRVHLYGLEFLIDKKVC